MEKEYDVMIIGGSYAGLSAALALGRSLRKVLIIDYEDPSNKPSSHIHNFIGHDGEENNLLKIKAKEQLLSYSSVTFFYNEAVLVKAFKNSFEVLTQSGLSFTTIKLLFATGIRYRLPDIKGFDDCWGHSILHCPYCHGYEVHGSRLGILFNGSKAYEMAKTIQHIGTGLVIFTNGKSTIHRDKAVYLEKQGVEIIEKKIASLHHTHGALQQIVFTDGTEYRISILFTEPFFTQHCPLPERLGCALIRQGLIKITKDHETTVKGIYAAGDNCSTLRSIASSVFTGSKAGALINKSLASDRFYKRL